MGILISPILGVDSSELEELGKVVENGESQHGENVTQQSALVYKYYKNAISYVDRLGMGPILWDG